MTIFDGLRFFISGIRTAFSGPVRTFMVLPGLASLLIVGSGLYWGFGQIDLAAQWIAGQLPEWLNFLNVVIGPLMYLVGILAGAWLFGFTAMVIVSPFLGELSAKVDDIDANPTPWWQQILPTLAREARKLRYQLPRLLGLLLLTFIPIINAFAPILWLSYGAWMMAVHFCDYAHENRGRPFSETLTLLRQHRIGVMGFGACATVGMSIPLLNFTIAPIAVVGATLMMQHLMSLNSTTANHA